MVATAAYVGSQGQNLFLRGLSNIFRPGATTILDGTAIPTDTGIVNRTNAAGQVIGVTTVRQFSILSGTSVQNPYAEIDTKSSGGTDSYNSLQLTLTRRPHRVIASFLERVLEESQKFSRSSAS